MSTNVSWMSVFLGTFVGSLAGSIIPTFIIDTARDRAHAFVKGLNECLAKHQFAYLIFFATVSNARPSVDPNAGSFAQFLAAHTTICVIASLVLYVASVCFMVNQDKWILKMHRPTPECSGVDCTFRRLRYLWILVRICGAAFIATIVLFYASIQVAQAVK